MKRIIILGDGMADEPVEQFGGRTPLQAARKPNIDRIAREGRTGMFCSLRPDLPSGSAVANLGVMGYDPYECFQGRGVLEAASMGVEVGDGQMAMRCNLICIENGRIKNHSAGHIGSAEAAELIAMLEAELGGNGLHFYPGVSYRHLMVAKGLDPRVDCAPPHDHPGEPVADLLIRPENDAARATADRLNELTERSRELLAEHPINVRRRAEGRDPANSVWLWSPGVRPKMWTFRERFGVSGAVISAVDLIRGLGVYAGLEKIVVEGATGLWDTNYEGKAQATLDALDRVDFVYTHVEAPDEAGHEGNAELKLRTIEDLDRRLVGPILEGLERRGEPVAVAVLPDHPTPVAKRVHTRAPIPFAIRAPGLEADSVQVYDEQSCQAGAFGQLEGDQFIRAVFGQLDPVTR